ncbi:MAG: GGDEF domain-containing protein [Xanthomonadales bacterium]|nr:GGDEF domain-containing protein [Xanthomonadales bacterium]
MTSLDAYTLAVASALAAFFMAVTMGGIYLAGNRERAIADWALAGVLFSAGHVMGNLAMAGSSIVDTSVIIALGNTSILVAYGLILLGIQQHLGLRRSPMLVVALALAALAGGLFWPGMYANTGQRVMVFALVYLFLGIFSAALLWRAQSMMLANYRRAVAFVILGNAVLMLVRAIYILLGHGESTGAGAVNVMVPAFLSSMLFYMALNVTLALMLFRRKEEHLRYMARHDALTGLLNRYSLDEYAAREVARVQRGEHELSLVVLDLDDFKQVNDKYGHAAGDQVLVQAASRIREIIREADIAFRVGGEEFLVLLPDASAEVAGQVAERLRRALVDKPFECSERTMTVSTSVGVVTFDSLVDDWERLLRRADQALYRAKANGRDRVEVAGGPDSVEGTA